MNVIAAMVANLKLCKVGAFTTSLGSRFQVISAWGKGSTKILHTTSLNRT